jgi:hypothetical protein
MYVARLAPPKAYSNIALNFLIASFASSLSDGTQNFPSIGVVSYLIADVGTTTELTYQTQFKK